MPTVTETRVMRCVHGVGIHRSRSGTGANKVIQYPDDRSRIVYTFRQQFGAVPLCNKHGVAMRERDEFEVFSPAWLRRILYDL
jgi:hypothetical protein